MSRSKRIIAPGMLLAAWASWRVRSAFHKASEIPAASGLSVPDPTTLEDVSKVMERYSLEPPQSVSERMNADGFSHVNFSKK